MPPPTCSPPHTSPAIAQTASLRAGTDAARPSRRGSTPDRTNTAAAPADGDTLDDTDLHARSNVMDR